MGARARLRGELVKADHAGTNQPLRSGRDALHMDAAAGQRPGISGLFCRRRSTMRIIRRAAFSVYLFI